MECWWYGGQLNGGYRRNLSQYYSVINALTLMYLHQHLTNAPRFDREITSMWAFRFAAECELNVRGRFSPLRRSAI